MQKLVLFFIIVILAGAGYYFLSGQRSSSTEIASNQTILEGLAENLDLKAELREYGYADWIEDGKTLPMIGYNFFSGTVDINGIGKYKALELKDDDLEQITLANLKPLIETTDTYLTSLGFTKNTLNTRAVGDNPPAHFFGYDKNDMKCLVRIDEFSDPFGNFFCGTIDEEQRALQQEFTGLFAKDKDQIVSFRVQKVEGDYALGSANYVYTGFMWITKKGDGEWQIVWRGNDIALCSEMVKFDIPKSIYGTCYDEETQAER